MAGITLAGAGRGAAPFVQRNIRLCKTRENPSRLNYSTGGYGSPHYLATITLVSPGRIATEHCCARAVCRARPGTDGTLERQRAIHDHQHGGGHGAHR
jgi:hypothetical protein